MKNYQKELALLKQHYQQCFDYVRGHKLCEDYANEKIHHTLQVIGAGNYIMKHEAVFKNRSKEFIRCAVLAYLFHDIGRFEEIRAIYDKDKEGERRNFMDKVLDHGERGAKILAAMPEYNDLRIVIPVRHHGHMIEQFYADEEYQAITDESLKQEIKEIIFLARDADKIANLYLLKNQYDDYKELWYYNKDSEYLNGRINPKIEETFKNHQVIKHKDSFSVADYFLGAVSWVFDINYQISLDFINRHSLVDAVIKIIPEFNQEIELQQKLANYAKEYIESTNLNHKTEKNG